MQTKDLGMSSLCPHSEIHLLRVTPRPWCMACVSRVLLAFLWWFDRPDCLLCVMKWIMNLDLLLVLCQRTFIKFLVPFCLLLKPKKLTFSNFGNLRKKKQEDGEEYVCPMELGHASGSSSQKGFRTGLDMRLYEEDDLDRLEQVSTAARTHRHSDVPWKLCTLSVMKRAIFTCLKIKIVKYFESRRLPPASGAASALGILYRRCLGSVFRGDAEAQDPCGPCRILCHLTFFLLYFRAFLCPSESVRVSLSHCGLFLADGGFRRDGEADRCVLRRHQQSHSKCGQGVENVTLKASKAMNAHLRVGRCVVLSSVPCFPAHVKRRRHV